MRLSSLESTRPDDMSKCLEEDCVENKNQDTIPMYVQMFMIMPLVVLVQGIVAEIPASLRDRSQRAL